jgi:hypothetical protein
MEEEELKCWPEFKKESVELEWLWRVRRGWAVEVEVPDD